MVISRALWFAVLGSQILPACSAVAELSHREGSQPYFRIYRHQRVGFIDRYGRERIQTPFHWARHFYRDRAAVFRSVASLESKAGYIDPQGRAVIPLEFDDALDFRGPLAPVRVGRRWGYIDRAGRVAIPPQYQAAGEFREERARVYRWTHYTRRDNRGTITYSADNAPTYYFREPFVDPCEWNPPGDNGRFGFIDLTGRLVTRIEFEYAGEFQEGLAVVRTKGRYGFIDREGRMVIPPQWEWAGDFSNGRAQIRRQGRYGYIDSRGQVVIEPRFSFARDFREGVAAVEVRLGLWGYLDRNGKWAITPRFQHAWNFSDGVAAACRYGDSCRYIGPSGEPAVGGVRSPHFRWHFHDGLAPVEENELFNFAGLLAHLRFRWWKQDYGVVWIDQAGRVVARYRD